MKKKEKIAEEGRELIRRFFDNQLKKSREEFLDNDKTVDIIKILRIFERDMINYINLILIMFLVTMILWSIILVYFF
jgi:hypothetical protein